MPLLPCVPIICWWLGMHLPQLQQKSFPLHMMELQLLGQQGRDGPAAAFEFELALKPCSSSPLLVQGSWVYVNQAEPESSYFQKASSKPSTSSSPSCSPLTALQQKSGR